jgi:hypothetical protein
MSRKIEIKNIEERMHGDVKEHKHSEYDYWHTAIRVHAEQSKDQLPAGHVLERKPLSEKLILDLVEVTPIQKMSIGASLEVGAVQSLMEGLQHHRHAASTLIKAGQTLTSGAQSWVTNQETFALFYAEWNPNHSEKTHRYLIDIRRGEEVYVGYFPYDGCKPRLYGIYHKKQDVIKFLHRTHDPSLNVPSLTLLTELNIPNIQFCLVDPSPIGAHTTISHKQGAFYTRSVYGEFVPFENNVIASPKMDDWASPGRAWLPDRTDDRTVVRDEKNEVIKVYKNDSTGFNMNDPKHPYYMFQGASGYIQLFEGKMFCYPDGSIRFLTPTEEVNVFRDYTDLQIVQGDLVAYEVQLPDPQKWDLKPFEGVGLDRHEIRSDKMSILRFEDKHFVVEDSTLTITHPEHGEIRYEARKGEMLALLPGTSRPFQKNEGRD